MSTYTVRFALRTTIEYEVEADNEVQAKTKAYRLFDHDQDLNLETDFENAELESVTQNEETK